MPRPLDANEISAILRQSERDVRQPERTTVGDVGAQMAQALMVGGFAALGFGGVMTLLQAPGDVTLQIALTSGMIFAGIAGALRIIPGDKRRAWQERRRWDATIRAERARKEEAYRAIERLEAEHAAEIIQWQHANQELRNDNRTLRAQLTRYQEAQRSPNYTTRSNVAAGVVGDAGKILEHWFATLGEPDAAGQRRGEWWSRPKAQAAGWTKSRQETAAELLDDAGITGSNGRLTFVLPQYRTLDAALFALNKYCAAAAAEPEMPRRQMVMSNEDED